MKNRRNYYRILHVQPDAPQAIIKASYRALMQKLRMHPDLGGDEWNAAILNEAYAILSHPDKRKAYDRERKDCQTERSKTGSTSPERHYTDRPVSSNRGGLSCPFCGNPQPPTSSYGQPPDCPDCNAPRELPTQPGMAGSMQRTIERRDRSGPLRFFTSPDDHRGNQGAFVDLSPAGLQFTSPVECGTDQVIRIDSAMLAATLRVTHCLRVKGRPGFLIGGAFLTLRFHNHRGAFISENA